MEDVEVKELWGQKFDIVEKGLDEAQVTAYVGDLLERYNTLAEDQKHLNSLRQLAENLVKEADNLAADLKQSAQREAEAEAAAIVARAQEGTQKIVAEAEFQAHAKAQSIFLEAQREVRRIQVEVKELLSNAYTKLLADLESVSQDIEAVVEETEGQDIEVVVEEIKGQDIEPTTIQAEAGGQAAEQEPGREVKAQVNPEEQRRESLTEIKEIELIAAPFISMKELLKFRDVLATPQEIQLRSMASLKDGYTVQFSLGLSAGFKLDEHLQLTIPGIVVTDHGDGRVEARLPQPKM